MYGGHPNNARIFCEDVLRNPKRMEMMSECATDIDVKWRIELPVADYVIFVKLSVECVMGETPQ